MWPRRGVPIEPVAIQTPVDGATAEELGTADGAADSLGLGDVASGDAVATATTDGAGTGGTIGRQPQEAGARRQRPADEQQGCGGEQRDAATPAGSSGKPLGLPAAIKSVDREVERQRAQVLLQDPAEATFERGVVELRHVAPPRRASVRRRGPSAGA